MKRIAVMAVIVALAAEGISLAAPSKVNGKVARPVGAKGLVQGDGGCVKHPPPLRFPVSVVDGINLTQGELQEAFNGTILRGRPGTTELVLTVVQRDIPVVRLEHGTGRTRPTTVTLEYPMQVRTVEPVGIGPYPKALEVKLEQGRGKGTQHVRLSIKPVLGRIYREIIDGLLIYVDGDVRPRGPLPRTPNTKEAFFRGAVQNALRSVVKVWQRLPVLRR